MYKVQTRVSDETGAILDQAVSKKGLIEAVLLAAYNDPRYAVLFKDKVVNVGITPSKQAAKVMVVEDEIDTFHIEDETSEEMPESDIVNINDEDEIDLGGDNEGGLVQAKSGADWGPK